MRRFLAIGHDAPIEPGIDLDDIPGSAGRLDVLCRCVSAGLLHSHGIRSDSEVVTIHQDTVTIRFDGEDIQQLHPDERSTAARFDAALEDVRDAVGLIEVNSAPGITVSRHDLSALLETIETPIVQLHPDGDPLPAWDPSTDATFVLSDHRAFDADENEILEERADAQLSLSPKAIHADQAITVMHNYLDTAGYHEYS